MLLLFLQSEINWERWIGESIVFALVVAILVFILKALPIWKEIKLAEINVRDKEAESLGQLGNALNQIGDTMKDVAIEQRRATDNVKILQRANADESNNIIQSVDALNERLDTLEETMQEQGIYATRPKAIKKN